MYFVQLIDVAMEYFNSIVGKDNLTLTMGGLDVPLHGLHTLSSGAYVSDSTFSQVFKGHQPLGSPTIS
jgi:hypothetical protein